MDTKSKDLPAPERPWGLLKGVRPGKIVHHLWEDGQTDKQVKDFLRSKYEVTEEKAELLLRVCQEERKCFHSAIAPEQDWGMYIGVPFCPSRCVYCSFPSHSMKQVGHLLEPFYDHLLLELEQTIQDFPELKELVTLLYIGGGTPACLNSQQTRQLLDWFRQNFPRLQEITFEGGRPEMMTEELLGLLYSRVDRICINPQTLQDTSLQRIGRLHTARDAVMAMENARRIGFTWINMDLIAGLPGESEEDFVDSLQKIIHLQPENITVHALAIKRASPLKQETQILHSLSHGRVEAMIRQSQTLLSESGYLPYYLYRQRDIMAGAENIGYTKPGYASRYNALMIAERMNILGFGVGAASKLLVQKQENLDIHRIANPKDLFVYLERGPQENAEKKYATLSRILRGESDDY